MKTENINKYHSFAYSVREVILLKKVHNYARAIIRGGEDNPNLTGTAEFYQRPNGVLVIVHVKGLPNKNESQFFGLHIHEGKSCLGEDFGETLNHFNPKNTMHSYHAGDLPPLLSCNSMAYMSVLTNRFKLNDIIGRTIVIHSNPDDFTTQPSGNSGRKIACGVIMRK